MLNLNSSSLTQNFQLTGNTGYRKGSNQTNPEEHSARLERFKRSNNQTQCSTTDLDERVIKEFKTNWY